MMEESQRLDDYPDGPREHVGCLEDLWQALHGVQEWVRFADAKAGATLAADGVLIAMFAGPVRDHGKASALATGMLVAALALAGLSALSALAAVYPRIPMVKPKSLLYFDHVSRYQLDADYHAAAIRVFKDPELLARTITDQIWAFSRQARRKYTHVVWAILLLAASACAGIPTLLFI
jgi:hypothetical protein